MSYNPNHSPINSRRKLALWAGGLAATLGIGIPATVHAVDGMKYEQTSITHTHLAGEHAKETGELPDGYALFQASYVSNPTSLAEDMAKDGDRDQMKDEISDQVQSDGRLMQSGDWIVVEQSELNDKYTVKEEPIVQDGPDLPVVHLNLDNIK